MHNKSQTLRLFLRCWLRFYRASSYASAVLGVVILSVCPSLCPSLTRVLCDKTKQCTADSLIPHSSFLTPSVVGGRRPFRLKFALKMTHPSFAKRRLRQISAYNVSTVRDSETKIYYDEFSRPLAFQRAIDRVCTLLLSTPKWWLDKQCFLNKQINRIKTATKFREKRPAAKL